MMEVLLTPPISLEWASATNNNEDEQSNVEGYSVPNLLQRIFSLFRSIRPGTDLTRFQLPPTFNIPKSQLQIIGELVYGVNKDMLRVCSSGNSPVDRIIAVAAWWLSVCRVIMFGVAPYNSILGETHHVSRGSLNVLLEHVSHHPPVNALHATDASCNIELVWCLQTVPKFCGTSIEADTNGQIKLKLLTHEETYTMNIPKLLIRLLPMPGTNLFGDVKVKCQETNLEVELQYKKGSSFFMTNNNRSLKGKLVDSSSTNRTTLYEIEGQWNNVVTVKDAMTGNVRPIYDAKEVISGIKTPIVKDLENVMPTESALVWAEVSRGILSKNWDKAKDKKRRIEEKERELVKERKARKENWSPKHFVVFHSKELGWSCDPICNSVSPAPIIYPI